MLGGSGVNVSAGCPRNKGVVAVNGRKQIGRLQLNGRDLDEGCLLMWWKEEELGESIEVGDGLE